MHFFTSLSQIPAKPQDDFQILWLWDGSEIWKTVKNIVFSKFFSRVANFFLFFKFTDPAAERTAKGAEVQLNLFAPGWEKKINLFERI